MTTETSTRTTCDHPDCGEVMESYSEIFTVTVFASGDFTYKRHLCRKHSLKIKNEIRASGALFNGMSDVAGASGEIDT